jgi:hypothetical protein
MPAIRRAATVLIWVIAAAKSDAPGGMDGARRCTSAGLVADPEEDDAFVWTRTHRYA